MIFLIISLNRGSTATPCPYIDSTTIHPPATEDDILAEGKRPRFIFNSNVDQYTARVEFIVSSMYLPLLDPGVSRASLVGH